MSTSDAAAKALERLNQLKTGTFLLIVILVVACIATWALAHGARAARNNEANWKPKETENLQKPKQGDTESAMSGDSVRSGNELSGSPDLIAADYTNGLKFGTEIIAFAVALAGFFGMAAGTRNVMVAAPITTGDLVPLAAGLGGVLAGASLLGVGGWAAPVALGGLALSPSILGVAKIMKA